MRKKFPSSVGLVAVVLAVAGVPALAQNKVAHSKKAEAHWLQLARNIIAWSRDTKTDHSFEQSQASEQLSALPKPQRVAGLRYLVVHHPIPAQSVGAAEELFAIEPTSANLDLILPKFKKWDSPNQEDFLSGIVADNALFFPRFAQWREMIRQPLLVGARQKVNNERPKAVEVAALIVAERLSLVSPDAKELIHGALRHNPTLPDLWNALALLQDVRPDEQQAARTLFASSASVPDLRLALAVALSPSDEAMRSYVARRLQSALEASTLAGKNEGVPLHQGINELNTDLKTAFDQTKDLRALRFWEASRSRPFLARASRQSRLRESLFPIWALRFPSALFVSPTDAPQTGVGYAEAIVLAGLRHEKWRRPAQERLGKELFKSGVQNLQDSGIANVFGASTASSPF